MKDPITEAEHEVAALQSRGELLRQKLIGASTALETATDVRRASLLNADLSNEEACQRRDQLCRDARDCVAAIEDAMQAIEIKIADASAGRSTGGGEIGSAPRERDQDARP
jgi:hypothetical protein